MILKTNSIKLNFGRKKVIIYNEFLLSNTSSRFHENNCIKENKHMCFLWYWNIYLVTMENFTSKNTCIPYSSQLIGICITVSRCRRIRFIFNRVLNRWLLKQDFDEEKVRLTFSRFVPYLTLSALTSKILT